MRKIIQIAVAGVENTCATQAPAIVFALCDDGALFSGRYAAGETEWEEWPQIPQHASEAEKENR